MIISATRAQPTAIGTTSGVSYGAQSSAENRRKNWFTHTQTEKVY